MATVARAINVCTITISNLEVVWGPPFTPYTAVEKRRHLPFPSTFERKCWWYAKKRNIVQCTRVHYITYCIFIKKNLINSHFHQITFQIHNKTYEIRLFLSLIHSHKKRWKVSLWRLCSAFFKFNSFGNAGDRPSVSPLPCEGYSARPLPCRGSSASPLTCRGSSVGPLPCGGSSARPLTCKVEVL